MGKTRRKNINQGTIEKARRTVKKCRKKALAILILFIGEKMIKSTRKWQEMDIGGIDLLGINFVVW